MLSPLRVLSHKRVFAFIPTGSRLLRYTSTHARVPPGGSMSSRNRAPSTATSTSPPPRTQSDHASAQKVEPTTAPDSAYWNDQSPATSSSAPGTRPAPEPSDSGLTGKVESVEINLAPGLELRGHMRQVVGAVLDLLQGKVNKQKMERRFWADDAVFEDWASKAVGIVEVDAKWWGLKAIMSDIDMIEHKVISVAPKRVDMEVVNKYSLKALPGVEKEVRSIVSIELDGDDRIKRVCDKWNGKLPEGKISEYFRRAAAISTAKVVNVPEHS